MNKLEKDFKLFANDHGVSNSVLDDYSRVLTKKGYYIEPTIIEESPHYMAQLSVFSRLFMERILFIGTEINNDVANIVNSQLLYLQMDNNKKPVTLYINSPGGSVYDGMSIYDTMNFISCPVHTVCTGLAASMASILLAAGEQGQRSALPHSRIMIHQPMGGVHGQASDIEITAKEILKLKQELYQILSDCSGKTYEDIEKDGERDHWMTALEAKNYGKFGLIDKVIIKE